MPLNLAITNEQKIAVTLNPSTAAGNPAQVEAGSVKFNVIEGDATIELIDGAELSAYLVSGSAGASNVIEVSADADLGEGVKPLTDIVTLQVVAAEAAGLGLIAGEAILK